MRSFNGKFAFCSNTKILSVILQEAFPPPLYFSFFFFFLSVEAIA